MATWQNYLSIVFKSLPLRSRRVPSAGAWFGDCQMAFFINTYCRWIGTGTLNDTFLKIIQLVTKIWLRRHKSCCERPDFVLYTCTIIWTSYIIRFGRQPSLNLKCVMPSLLIILNVLLSFYILAYQYRIVEESPAPITEA